MPAFRYTEARLQGKALEEAFTRGADDPLPLVVQMRKHEDAPWEMVGAGPAADRKDTRVRGIVEWMDRIRWRVTAGMRKEGWVVVVARIFVKGATGKTESLDLLLKRDGSEGPADAAVVELTWSEKTVVQAQSAGEKKLAKYFEAVESKAVEAELFGTLAVAKQRFSLNVYHNDGSIADGCHHRHTHPPTLDIKPGCQKRAKGIGVTAEEEWRVTHSDWCVGYVAKAKAKKENQKPKKPTKKATKKRTKKKAKKKQTKKKATKSKTTKKKVVKKTA